MEPRKALRGGISKVNFQETLSSFGGKCPHNGSKNDPGMANYVGARRAATTSRDAHRCREREPEKERVRERKRESEREKERERYREKERASERKQASDREREREKKRERESAATTSRDAHRSIRSIRF